ncbi:2-acylglycerol O-acyltransferase 1 [Ataeniobius toweri]|uniref:2-acylglycerol O-acyltransferase 1 n=1 Tax=Ataeniobius toweri TaxID=208326 RepID=A0ABU7A527_9TELE|nr:2-acylglycerol O-acyltransferase 1 [Ataeniobius toweri]
MKIQFAPLNVPLQRRLQTAAVLQWVFSFLALAQCCLAAFVLLALSDWWILALLYAGWLWLDWDTPTTGGRRSQWVRNWTVWEYLRDYFPLMLVKTVDLDPTKNYIFGFHPHGCSSLSLEELSCSATAPCMWWETLSKSDGDLKSSCSLTTCTGSREHPGTGLSLISSSNHFL